jgi:hypothetical protein
MLNPPLLFTTLALLASTVSAATPSAAPRVHLGGENLEALQIQHPGLYPEDIKYNEKTGTYLTGSFREGAIYTVTDRGETRQLVNDDRLVSTLGICLDTAANRLYTVTGDLGASVKKYPGIKTLAALGVYDLTTGAPVRFVYLHDLLPGRPHLANSVTTDGRGNVYVTDSFSPVIYKIPPTGAPSIFLESDRFIGEGINLNGIVYHPGGYLLVALKSKGQLFKVPVDNPQAFTEVKLPRPLVGLDGVTLVNPSELVVVANRAGAINTDAAFALQSPDDWATATVTGEYKFGDVYPTAAVVKDGQIYVLHSGIRKLVAAPADQKTAMTETATLQLIGRVDREAVFTK